MPPSTVWLFAVWMETVRCRANTGTHIAITKKSASTIVPSPFSGVRRFGLTVFTRYPFYEVG